MVRLEPRVGRRDGHYIAFEFRPKEHSEYIFSRWVEACRGCWPPYQERITEGPIGREMESGFISTLTEVAGRFNYGRYNSTGPPVQGNQKWRRFCSRVCGRTLSLLLEA